MVIEQFHFIRPWWFLMLIPLLACLWLMVNRKFTSRSWEKICDPTLLPHILIQQQGHHQKRSVTLFGLTALITIIALAGPSWERLPQPVFRSDSALVILLDLSRSMDAPDLSPSRLERVRYKIIDMLDQRREGETALIVYAGDAFTVSPLTNDVKTIKAMLPALSTSLMPLQGHRADLALELASSIMKQAGHVSGEMILITDEIDPDRDSDKVRKINSDGYRVSVLGVGTSDGAPVTLQNGGFLKSRSGEIVIPTLDSDSLEQFAVAGGGIYRTIQATNSDIDALMNSVNFIPSQQSESETRFKSDVWQEQGPWLVLLLLPLAALSFRRGLLLVFTCLLVPLPRPAQALDWQSLWLNQDQRAHQLLQAGKHEQAAELFKDQNWKAAAQYRAGKYTESLKSYEASDDLTSLYNRGNALAKSGQFEQAIAAYESVLEQQADHEDAAFNLELIKKQQEKQNKTMPPQNESGGGDNQAEDETGEERPYDQSEGEDGEQSDANDELGPQQSEDNALASQNLSSSSQSGKQQHGDQEATSGEEQDEQDKDNRQSGQGTASEASDEPVEDDSKSMAGNSSMERDEREMEQWLRRIPDDPGGLLKKKFLLQYKQRGLSRHNYEQDW